MAVAIALIAVLTVAAVLRMNEAPIASARASASGRQRRGRDPDWPAPSRERTHRPDASYV